MTRQLTWIMCCVYSPGLFLMFIILSFLFFTAMKHFLWCDLSDLFYFDFILVPWWNIFYLDIILLPWCDILYGDIIKPWWNIVYLDNHFSAVGPFLLGVEFLYCFYTTVIVIFLYCQEVPRLFTYRYLVFFVWRLSTSRMKIKVPTANAGVWG